MPPMPYVMEIGPVFSLLNDYVETKQHKVRLLKELRDKTIVSLAGLEVFGSASAGTLPNNPIIHIEHDWFGFTPNHSGQPQFNPANPRPTGWWTRWYGDADKITRETLARALEVALGVPHDENDHNPVPTRDMRIQFIWTCGAPFFQGWVSWMWEENELDEGVVTVTFTTPGNGHPLYATPFRPQSASAALDYEVDPPTPPDDEEYGMWVIGQELTDIRRPNRLVFENLGRGVLPALPNAFIRTHGGVVVVSPAEVDGGMLHAGRNW